MRLYTGLAPLDRDFLGPEDISDLLHLVLPVIQSPHTRKICVYIKTNAAGA